MKKIDLKNKTLADLGGLLVTKREALRVFRFGSAGAKSKNVKEGKALNKDIARIMTKITELGSKS
jgi:ribosomal protein L29